MLNSKLRFIFFASLFFWFAVAIVRTPFNLSKFFTEDLKEISTPDNEKRLKVFGDEYLALEYLASYTSDDSSILFISDDLENLTGFYYEIHYFLYPRNLHVESSNETNSIRKYDYVTFIEKKPSIKLRNSTKIFKTEKYTISIYKNE